MPKRVPGHLLRGYLPVVAPLLHTSFLQKSPCALTLSRAKSAYNLMCMKPPTQFQLAGTLEERVGRVIL